MPDVTERGLTLFRPGELNDVTFVTKRPRCSYFMSVLSPLLWSFLPSQLASVLLPYATQLLPALFPPAPRGSPLYARNHRWVYTALIVGYLGWTWKAGDSSDDWYAMLDVPRWAEDDELKKAFRTL